MQFDPEDDVEPPRPPRVTAMDRLARHVPARSGAQLMALRLAWAASVLLLLALVVAGILWRSEVARAWPPSQRVYDALGLSYAPPAAH